MASEDILAGLPHREPFLFLDEILSIDEKAVVAKRSVSGEEDFFRGHYPQQPIMPGVLLCECIFQAGAYFLGQTQELESEGLPVVTRIQNVRFRSPVKPGDELTIHAELKEKLGSAFFMSGRIERDGKRVVSLEFACTLIPGDGR